MKTNCINDTNDGNNYINGLLEKSNELNAKNAVKEVVVEDTNQTIQPKEANSQPKQQKASESKSKSKTEQNRKRKMCRNNQKSEKGIMRMKDLLLYNPPMTDEQKEMRDKDVDQSEKATESQTSEMNCTKYESDTIETQETTGYSVQHVYTNRTIEKLFESYANSKFYLAKDNLYEVIITR